MKTIAVVCLLALLAACSDYKSPTSPVTPPPEGQTVSVVYCDTYTPLWVGFEDGDGAWTHVQPLSTNGTRVYRFTFASNRGAIATVLEASPGTTSLQVLYGAPTELASIGLNTPRICGITGDKKLLGTVAGVDSTDVAVVRSGSGTLTTAHSGEDFAIDHLADGPQDILASRATLVNPGEQLLTKFILRRGVNLPDNSSLPVLDFGAPESFAPVVANVTVGGDGVDGAYLLSLLRTANFEDQFSIPFPGATGLTQSYYALPEAQLAAGDLQELNASTHGSTPGASRNVRLYFRTPVDRALEFGPDVITPTFTTLASTPSLRIRAQFVAQDEYDRQTAIAYFGPTTTVAVLMTATYAAVAGGYDLVMPELAGVAGFDVAWELPVAASVRWAANRMGGTLGLGIDPVPTEGAIRRAASAGDVITP